MSSSQVKIKTSTPFLSISRQRLPPPFSNRPHPHLYRTPSGFRCRHGRLVDFHTPTAAETDAFSIPWGPVCSLRSCWARGVRRDHELLNPEAPGAPCPLAGLQSRGKRLWVEARGPQATPRRPCKKPCEALEQRRRWNAGLLPPRRSARSPARAARTVWLPGGARRAVNTLPQIAVPAGRET